MSKISTKRLRQLALREAVATADEVRALVLEVKGARAMIERFDATLLSLRHPQKTDVGSAVQLARLGPTASSPLQSSVLN